MGWGVDVTRVELQAIEPPRDIQHSMELVMRAERERRAAVTNAEAGKRAAILESEGQREAQVRKAEGEKEAAILRAEGLAAARLAMAQAEAEAIQRITAALPEGQAAVASISVPRGASGVTQKDCDLPSAEATGVMGALGGMREFLIDRGAEAQLEEPTKPPTSRRRDSRRSKTLASPAETSRPRAAPELSWLKTHTNAPKKIAPFAHASRTVASTATRS